MTITRYGGRSSWSLLDDLLDLQEDFNRTFSGWGSPAASRFPAINAWTSDDEVILEAEVPGLEPKDIDVSVVGSTVTLTGTRNPDEQKEGETCHRRERRFGRFVRTLDLPFEVDGTKAKATQRNGILRVSLPRTEADKPRKISIQAA